MLLSSALKCMDVPSTHAGCGPAKARWTLRRAPSQKGAGTTDRDKDAIHEPCRMHVMHCKTKAWRFRRTPPIHDARNARRVWDGQGAVDAVSGLISEGGRDEKAITNRLINVTIRERGAKDNCSVMVIRFLRGR